VTGVPETLGSYSYQGQDRFVLEALGGLRNGYFLDSGASDGLKGSNTWLLESDYGWSGICVEPNGDSFRKLERNRACICLNCCLYDQDQTVEFLEVAGVYGGIISEYDPRQLRFTRGMLRERWPENSPPPTVSKQARTIRAVLGSVSAPKTIDYWSLDTEGSEVALLRSFPFDEYRLRVLTVEHNNGPMREQIRILLEARGYVRVRALGIDDGYILADEIGSGTGEATGRSWRSGAWRGRRRTRAGFT
jgi:Methyltransferase FkbM domain